MPARKEERILLRRMPTKTMTFTIEALPGSHMTIGRWPPGVRPFPKAKRDPQCAEIAYMDGVCLGVRTVPVPRDEGGE